MIAAILIVAVVAAAQVGADDLPTRDAFLAEVKEALASVEPNATLCHQMVQEAQDNGAEEAAMSNATEVIRQWGVQQLARLNESVTAYEQAGGDALCSEEASDILQEIVLQSLANLKYCVESSMADAVLNARVCDSWVDHAKFFWDLAQKEVALPDGQYGSMVPLILQESHKLTGDAERSVNYIQDELADLAHDCTDLDNQVDVDRILNYANTCTTDDW